MRLLLVEDDKDLSEFVCDWLSREGFVIDTAANGEQALHQAEESDYDVILLDVMMPRVDGYTVLKNLRSKGYKGAILLVTCKGQEKDKLQGLNNGADDYIVKPFLLTELVARVRAVLRRTTGGTSKKGAKASLLHVGEFQMDLLKREVKRGGKAILLTKREYDLLECFLRRPGQVVSPSVLSRHLSGSDSHTNTNTIEVHIKNLRNKIDSKSRPSFIRTVRGCGYVMDA